MANSPWTPERERRKAGPRVLAMADALAAQAREDALKAEALLLAAATLADEAGHRTATRNWAVIALPTIRRQARTLDRTTRREDHPRAQAPARRSA